MAEPPPVPDAVPPQAGAMTLLEHLDELRIRLVRTAIGIGASFLLCYWQADALMQWCQAPYRVVVDHPLAVMAVSEAFFVKVRVAFMASLFLAAPWIGWQAWGFVRPGLHPQERRLAVPFVLLVSAFFVGGGAFGYYVGLPAMLRFLLGQSAQGFEPVIRAESYIHTFTSTLLGMGLVFEAPVVAGLLARLGLLTPGFLWRKRGPAVIIIAILAAFITPSGDVPTMLIFAFPMVALYVLSMLVAWLAVRRTRAPDAQP